jgi:hypothetical protein
VITRQSNVCDDMLQGHNVDNTGTKNGNEGSAVDCDTHSVCLLDWMNYCVVVEGLDDKNKMLDLVSTI